MDTAIEAFQAPKENAETFLEIFHIQNRSIIFPVQEFSRPLH